MDKMIVVNTNRKPEVVNIERITPKGQVKLRGFDKNFKLGSGDQYHLLGEDKYSACFTNAYPYSQELLESENQRYDRIVERDNAKRAEMEKNRQEQDQKMSDAKTKWLAGNTDSFESMKENKIDLPCGGRLYQGFISEKTYGIIKIEDYDEMFSDDPKTLQAYSTYCNGRSGSFNSMSGLYGKVEEDLLLESIISILRW